MSADRSGALRRLCRRLLVLTLLAGFGCVSSLPNPFSRQRPQDVFLEVENHNWAEMTISIVRSGARARLGNVGTNQTRRFTLPRDMAGSGATMSFQADPVGSSRSYRSEEISVSGGETWVWILRNQLDQSTLYIR